MLTFMDYIVHAFGESTDWNYDNSYSSLTATSDAILSFPTPSSLSLNVSSLSTPNFATSYTLSTLGQIDGSISYLYSTVPVGHIPSRSTSIPLRYLVRGYRDVKLPTSPRFNLDGAVIGVDDGRKPTLLHATLALPPPSTLTALYARRISPEALLSISLNSKSTSAPPTNSAPPPAAVLAHLQYDTGRFSVEGLGSTDHALLGVRGLWNFGLGRRKQHVQLSDTATAAFDVVTDLTDLAIPASTKPPSIDSLASKPSLLSAGGEFYYSPTSHVIGLSTGLRFTTLAPLTSFTKSSSNSRAPIVSSSKPLAGTSAALSNALLTPSNIPHSSFPYTMTLTLTPLTGSLASTYSVKPTPNLALSSRFDFNVYSWESRYVLGAEIWRRRRSRRASSSAFGKSEDDDPIAWARAKLTSPWFSEADMTLKSDRILREEENVVKLRVDDAWNIRALWTGRIKELLVSAGVTISPVGGGRGLGGNGAFLNAGSGSVMLMSGSDDRVKRWTGTLGVEIAYST